MLRNNNDIRKILENENIKNGFKNITVKDLINALNTYVGQNLYVGDIYLVNDIHNTVRQNIENGFIELLSKNGIDYSVLREILYIGIWQVCINFDYEDKYIMAEIGRYNIDWTDVRKNASAFNKKRKLVSEPTFDFKFDNVDTNISLYDFIIFLLEDDRDRILKHYKEEIESHKRNIEDLSKQVEILENQKIIL